MKLIKDKNEQVRRSFEKHQLATVYLSHDRFSSSVERISTSTVKCVHSIHLTNSFVFCTYILRSQRSIFQFLLFCFFYFMIVYITRYETFHNSRARFIRLSPLSTFSLARAFSFLSFVLSFVYSTA